MRAGALRGRFRWRLTLTFVLVAGASAAVLATIVFLSVRADRERSFTERALRDVRLNLALAEERFGSVVEPAEVRNLVARFQRREGFDSVVVTGVGTFQSNQDIALEDVPAELREDMHVDGTSSLGTELGGAPYMVVASRLDEQNADFYLFFPRQNLVTGLLRLARILLLAWIAVVFIAGVVGSSLARRVLRPMARASLAAREIAGGRLHARLPVESDDEFGAWARSFNEMADALEEKIGALGQARDRERRFTSDVSHELRTPLTALTTSASMLREHLDRLPPAVGWDVDQVIKQASRLRGLVEELMEISRLDAGVERVSLEEVDIGELVGRTTSQRGWEVVQLIEDADLKVTSDPPRIERIVVNLIENAISHGGDPVRVVVRREGHAVVVEVSDEGEGIPAEAIPHVFERFFKTDSARRGGSGLGLAIAAENATLLGAHIQVDEERDKGARFILSLPVTASLQGGD